jgi:hypothetical protein
MISMFQTIGACRSRRTCPSCGEGELTRINCLSKRLMMHLSTEAMFVQHVENIQHPVDKSLGSADAQEGAFINLELVRCNWFYESFGTALSVCSSVHFHQCRWTILWTAQAKAGHFMKLRVWAGPGSPLCATVDEIIKTRLGPGTQSESRLDACHDANSNKVAARARVIQFVLWSCQCPRVALQRRPLSLATIKTSCNRALTPSFFPFSEKDYMAICPRRLLRFQRRIDQSIVR